MKQMLKETFSPLLTVAIAAFLGASFLTCETGMCGTSQDTSTVQKAQKDKAQQMYTCPMHPQVVSDKPGKCPICGMNLVPKAPAKKDKK